MFDEAADPWFETHGYWKVGRGAGCCESVCVSSFVVSRLVGGGVLGAGLSLLPVFPPWFLAIPVCSWVRGPSVPQAG